MTTEHELWRHREEAKEGEDQPMTPSENDQQPDSTPQPVAYDAEGRPLYAEPPRAAQSQTQYVHMTRSSQPEQIEIHPEVQRRHEESVKAFPHVNLSDHEYVIREVRRHPIGMVAPLLMTALSIAVVLIFIMNYQYMAEVAQISDSAFGWLLLMGVLLIIGFLIGGYLAIWVYLSNRFILTNESVIQEIQHSIFSKKEQTVSLMNIEDASFDQKGPLQSILNYGKIRLSTEGEETTYRFDYVANPKYEIATLNNAVEAFKNGRPVNDPASQHD